MEKKYEITEKQLTFLKDYLERKYPSIADETRIELIDHLISDFEASTTNGNLSQYLSNKMGFIRRFVFRQAKRIELDYNKDVWKEYYSFFLNFKKLPITLFVFCLVCFLSYNLSNKFIYPIFFFSVFGVYGYSLFAQSKNIPKTIRMLPEVQNLGKGITMGIPYIMSIVFIFPFDTDILLQYELFFTFYWFFAFSLSIACIIVLLQKKKIILEKYKHLLN